jgi:non-ribosomal peptide synthetase component E (peptide arylation enzyme)
MDPRLADLSHLMARPVAAWRAAGWWGQTPLWERVCRAAASNPDRVAVIDETDSLTAAALWREAKAVAAALRGEGVGRGDIVLLQLPNWHEFAVLVVALEAIGAVLAFCPSSWGPSETARALNLLRPRIWLVAGIRSAGERIAWVRDSLRLATFQPQRVVGVRLPSEEIMPFDRWRTTAGQNGIEEMRDGGRGLNPLEIAVTSGTTGEPKGVLHVHDSALATVQSTIERQGIGPQDAIHVAIPVGHTFGYFYGVRCALQAGAVLLLQERWNAERAAELVERWKATVSLGPAACIVDLLSLPSAESKRLASLRLFTQSGDPLPRPVAERAAAAFSFRVSRALGMTEFGHAAATDADSPPERMLDSAGSPQPGITIEIRDAEGRVLPAGEEGRIHVAGPFLFSGYLREDRLDHTVFDERGFFETGDLGWLGEDGYVHVTGREKNIIRRGAVTIPTAAIEDALAAHPAVHHAVLVALGDERLGEIAAACIQPHSGQHPPSLSDLQSHLDGLGITRAFWPEVLLVVSEWPIGPTGKIDRGALLQHLEARKRNNV